MTECAEPNCSNNQKTEYAEPNCSNKHKTQCTILSWYDTITIQHQLIQHRHKLNWCRSMRDMYWQWMLAANTKWSEQAPDHEVIWMFKNVLHDGNDLKWWSQVNQCSMWSLYGRKTIVSMESRFTNCDRDQQNQTAQISKRPDTQNQPVQISKRPNTQNQTVQISKRPNTQNRTVQISKTTHRTKLQWSLKL